MVPTFFKRLSLLSLLLLAQPLTIFSILMTVFFLSSAPLLGFITANIVFVIGMMAFGLIPGLFFQEAVKNHRKPLVAFLLLWYVMPSHWLGAYEAYSTLAWFFILVFFLLRTKNFTISYRYWLFFTALSAFMMHPLLYFSWTSDFSGNKGYENWTMNKISYHIASPWAHFFKEIHQDLPESIKNTKVLIIGFNKKDTSLLAESLGNKDLSLKIGGMAIPNPFESLFILNFQDVPEETLSDRKERDRMARIIVHEMTHIEQAQRYGVRFFMLPYWKKEAHATFVAKNYSLSGEYRAIQHLKKDQLPDIKNQTQMLLELNHDERFKNYDFFQLQGWYYLGYLEMDLDTFFSDTIDLADWMTVKEAWLETHKDWVMVYENQ